MSRQLVIESPQKSKETRKAAVELVVGYGHSFHRWLAALWVTDCASRSLLREPKVTRRPPVGATL